MLTLAVAWLLGPLAWGHLQAQELEADWPIFANLPAEDTLVAHAFRLLRSNRLDSTIRFVNSQLANFSRATQQSAPAALRLRVLRDEAHERAQEDDLATENLLVLEQDALAAKDWEVYAAVQLTLARVYEKLGFAPETETVLAKAADIIQDKALRLLEAQYHIRRASYFRVMPRQQDSAVHHAELALGIAYVEGQIYRYAEANLLLGMLTPAQETQRFADYYEAAGKAYRKAGDYNFYATVMLNLAAHFLRAGDPARARAYQDSARVVIRESEQRGDADQFNTYQAELTEGQLLFLAGKYREAYLKQVSGAQQQLSFVQQQHTARVAEIEANFADASKNALIKEQAAELATEKVRRNGLLMMILLALVATGIISWLYLRLRRQNQELALSYDSEVALRAEVHHRVKNNLQIIIGLLELQKNDLQEPAAVVHMDELRERIYSMSVLHEMIYEGDRNGTVTFSAYVNKLLFHLTRLPAKSEEIHYTVNVPPVALPLAGLMPLGMILHELVTNSLKYATSKKVPLLLEVKMERSEGDWLFQYQDNGPGFPEGVLQERSGGLGTFLLTRMVRQLEGSLTTENANGAQVKIQFSASIPEAVDVG